MMGGRKNVPLGEPGEGEREALPTTCEIGHLDDRVIMNITGNEAVEPSYVQWTPAQAREVAAKLIECADAVDPQGGAWCSIETAPPIDGQLCAVRRATELGASYAIARYRSGWWWGTGSSGGYRSVDHWLPVPDYDRETEPRPSRGAD